MKTPKPKNIQISPHGLDNFIKAKLLGLEPNRITIEVDRPCIVTVTMKNSKDETINMIENTPVTLDKGDTLTVENLYHQMLLDGQEML